MPHEVIRQLDEAVAEVFAVMLDLACTAAPLGTCAPAPELGLVAQVAFSGTLVGSCTIHLDLATAAELTANLTGLSHRKIPPALCADTAAELCNMIAGSWKARQPDDRAAGKLSCPIVDTAVCLGPEQAGPISRAYHFAGHRLAVHLAFQ